MNESTSNREPSRRIESMDVMRGVALFLIFVVHMLERYLVSIPTKGMWGRNPGKLNWVLSNLEPVLSGKGFAIFSMLFGLGCFLLMSSADRRGEPFKARFVWRLAVLFVIGFVNSLFFRGDILTTYALVGLLLVLFYDASNKTLAVVIGLIWAGLPQCILYFFFHGQPWIPGAGVSATTPINVAYHAAVTKGGLLDVFRANAWGGHLYFLYILFDLIGRAYLALSYFLVGIWLGRIGLFANLDAFHGRIKRALWISLALFVPAMVGSVAAASRLFAKGFVMSSWGAIFAIVGVNLAGTLMTVLIVCAVLLAFHTIRGKQVLSTLAPYGRMALTNYVLQSVGGAFLFYHWGLGAMAKVQHKHVALLSIVLFVLNAMLSAIWLRYFNYGPIEWLWRSATQRQWQRMRKGGSLIIEPASQGVSI